MSIVREVASSDFPPPPAGRSGWPWTEETDPGIYRKDYVYPSITIVTPSYNQGAFIEETIRSVLLQNYPALEYIIVDGGSTDHTVEIIRKYEKYLKMWVSEKDNGQSDAINKGIEKAEGIIFNWLNSDDYYTPGALHAVTHHFSVENADVICGQARNFGDDYEYLTPPSAFFDVRKGMITMPNINQPATFFRMKTVHELGPLNTHLHYCMDLEWWISYLFMHGSDRVRVTDDVLVNFREHGNSKTVSQSEKFIDDKLALFSAILARKDPSFVPMDSRYVFSRDISVVPLEFLLRLFGPEFFRNAIWAYGKRKMKRVRQLLQYVCEDYLSPDEKLLFRRMKLRAKYFPSFLFSVRDRL